MVYEYSYIYVHTVLAIYSVARSPAGDNSEGDALYSLAPIHDPHKRKPDINVCTIKIILYHYARALNAGVGGESKLAVVTPVWVKARRLL